MEKNQNKKKPNKSDFYDSLWESKQKLPINISKPKPKTLDKSQEIKKELQNTFDFLFSFHNYQEIHNINGKLSWFQEHFFPKTNEKNKIVNESKNTSENPLNQIPIKNTKTNEFHLNLSQNLQKPNTNTSQNEPLPISKENSHIKDNSSNFDIGEIKGDLSVPLKVPSIPTHKSDFFERLRQSQQSNNNKAQTSNIISIPFQRKIQQKSQIIKTGTNPFSNENDLSKTKLIESDLDDKTMQSPTKMY